MSLAQEFNLDKADASISLATGNPEVDAVEKAGLSLLALGLLALLVAFFGGSLGAPALMWWASVGAISAGALIYVLRHYLKQSAGVRNDHTFFSSLTARGAAAWVFGVVFTGFYVLLYWYPGTIAGLVRIHDPLSQLLRGTPADEWFLYGTFYTVAILVMGVRALLRYRHSRYHIVRTCVIMVVQLVFAYLLPMFLAAMKQPEFYFSYFWPLKYEYLYPHSIHDFWKGGAFGKFLVAWTLAGSLIGIPVLTYFFGKRWYCSWVCGCGGLANTFGDQWRHLSDKSLGAWKFERWSVHSVLVIIVSLTALLWINDARSEPFLGGAATVIKEWYGFFIGAMFAGVIGVGFYPIMGSRVWCRFGCPMAAALGLFQRFFSRFRITTNGAQCISCGNCSTYCEMGIDVKWYAQRGQNIVRASCVGCGMCSTVCPRGVLNLENGPREGRFGGALNLLGKWKAGGGRKE